jgi:large subunit ribosomal protein L29
MKHIKAQEIRNKTLEELFKLLFERKKELMNLRFQKANNILTNTSRSGVVKKDIAVIKTVVNENKKKLSNEG